MSCRRTKKSLLEYSGGGLSSTERESVRLHLESCPSCAALEEKLRLSAAALASEPRPLMSDETSRRVLASVSRQNAEARKPTAARLRGWRALGIGAAAAAVIVAIALFVGLQVGEQPAVVEREERAASGQVSDEARFSTEEATVPAAAAQKSSSVESELSAGPQPTPVVTASSSDYTQESLRAMVEALQVRKDFAGRFTLSDAAVLSGTYAKKAADEAAGHGIDGAELEAMISYISSSEAVLLPCYVESASFTGRPVWIIGFAAPPRTGSEVNLSRTEIWVMDPAKFESNPDSSIVFFLEYKGSNP